MSWTYPTDDLDNPNKTLSLLGSLWTNVYAGADFLEARVDARQQIAKQAFDDLKQAGELISRIDMPIWHRRNWYALYAMASDMTAETAVLYFDSPTFPAFDASPGFTFDQTITSTAVGIADVVDSIDLHDVQIITNRITDPSVVLHKDIDFTITTEGALVFVSNPFSNTLFPQNTEFSDGVVSDTQIVLWLCQPDFDWDLVYNHFGYVLGLELDTSEGYKNLINQVMDAHVLGTSQLPVETMVAEIYGIPLVLEDTETVMDIWSDSRHLLIITDQHVYEHRLGATATVTIGDTVYKGQPLIDAFVAYDIRDGTTFPDVGAITLPEGFLAPVFQGEISWVNDSVAVTVTGAAGNERVEWPLGGLPDDVEDFWDTVHQRRLVYGDSLYELLEAFYGTVPTTINPMQFLVTHVLRNNCIVIVIQASGISEDALNTSTEVWLRKILPPHTAVIVIIELPLLSGSVTMSGSGVGIGYGAEPIAGDIWGILGTISIW